MTVDHVAADLAGMAGVHRLRYAFIPLVREQERAHAVLGRHVKAIIVQEFHPGGAAAAIRVRYYGN